jgi:hypothetical protein
MAFTEVDFTLNGKTVYRIAATFHETVAGLYILYNAASSAQPVGIVPVASGLQLVESPTPAPPMPPSPPLSNESVWIVLTGREATGAARAYGVDATSQPGTIILSAKPVPPATGGVVLATFAQSASVSVVRAAFLIDPQPATLLSQANRND